MPVYRELAPPPHLARAVECIWTSRQDGPASLHRVLPDGCADILFTQSSGEVTLDVVGPMTTYRDFPMAEDHVLMGLRFRPGMWRESIDVPADSVIPLADVWGKRAKELLQRLADGGGPAALAAFVRPPEIGPVQRAIACLEQHRGSVAMDDLANAAGLSPRQLRRVILEETGLSPKFLARVLRFRHAVDRLRDARGDYAGLAADCGFYDQAHLIKDFRELAGKTPGRI